MLIGWTVLPHLTHLAPWVAAFTAVVLLWRARLALASAPLPGRWVLAGVLAVAVGLTLWSEQSMLSKTAGVTMLVLLMALKTLELRARRDALVVFFLGFFLVLTHCLYSQSLLMALHMALATWTAGEGWHDRAIVARRPFQLHPGAATFHYGQEIFEGLKAYRQPDGGVALFRPDRNAARFAQSARRLAMAPVDEADFVTAVTDLVRLDRDWVPTPEGEQSLYIRPFEIASETLIGVRAAREYTFCVIASPVGPYYPDPVTLWATPNYTRAAAGGTGAAKCGGNYAASLAAADEAAEHGCQQVIWLDGAEHRWVGSIVSTGFDGRVNYRSNHSKVRLGALTYGYSALAELSSFEPLAYRLVIDGVVREQTAMFIAVGNAGWFGGGMQGCPRASVTDGKLDITVINPVSRMTLLRLLPTMYTGGTWEAANVQRPVRRSDAAGASSAYVLLYSFSSASQSPRSA